ncbi:hypothetical protein V2J09_004450 [Rumex salicifolius]
MDPAENTSMEEEKEYRSPVARGIAALSGAVAMAILCCGDITVAALRRGFHFLQLHTHNNNNSHSHNSKGMGKGKSKAVAVAGLTTGIHWANNTAKTAEAVAVQILSWVVSLTRFVARVIFNSKPANALINVLPQDVVLATLNSFNKIWDAVETSRKNVASTFSGSTKELVSARYGENAGRAAAEGMETVAHAIGAVTAVSSIPSALHPNNAISPSSFAQLADTSSRNLHKKDA